MLPVTAPGAESVDLAGESASSQTISVAGTVELLIEPHGRKRRSLRRRGVAKVRVFVTFVPVGGVANTQPVTVRLRRVRQGAVRTATPTA